MKDVVIISEDFVRSNTNVSKNIQDKFIQSAVREATDIDFEQIVGADLLDKLKNLILKNEVGLPVNRKYKKLLEISKYFLAYSAVTRLIVISSVKIDNIGANVTNDDKATTIDFDDLFRLEKYYQNKADVYKKKIQDYLHKNKSDFEELNYVQDSNLYSAASTGIWLGGARGKGLYYEAKIKHNY